MTTRNEYLKLCIQNRTPLKKSKWYVSAFAIPVLTDKVLDEDDQYLDLVTKSDGLYFVNEDNTTVTKISDYVMDKPLINSEDRMDVDSTFMSNITKPFNCKIGTMIINAVIVKPELESKLPFMYENGEKLSIAQVNREISTRTTNPEDKQFKDSITVEDMIECMDNIHFFNSIGLIINIGASPKTITKATGMSEYVGKLLKDAGDDVYDPVKFVEIEDKIRAYDAEYLKGDLVAENLMSRKSGVGRQKMFGVYGNGLDFVNDRSNHTLVVRPIADGINPDPKELSKYFNDLRYASFSRGDNTALAGTIYKELQRSMASVVVLPEPCNTKQGIVKTMTKMEIAFAVGRYIKQDNKWVVISNIEEAKSLYMRKVEMRSPRTCTAPGNSLCYACMNSRYKFLVNGVSNMGADISAILLNLFLKLMHGIKVTTVKIDDEDLFG